MIGLVGPYDFLPLTDPVLKDVFPAPLRAANQPINFVSGDEPPVFLAAGRGDSTVAPRQYRPAGPETAGSGR
ncbi:hypothetical protein NDK50_12660 [Paraburkholderia bryophila]|uniref:hypothetical protein n=1 Tax=Paraburkholderia bryophila TaxID=420952 RepID=UPI00234917E1|nr:hypothetical protein [Paraburkholderia bryophila]WCM18316.1 hypothetical protein NDK50_12660 [Paraburkholderia bryophila]